MKKLCLALLFPFIALSQTSGGGKWTYGEVKDKMTDATHVVFVLEAENEVRDGIGTARPSLSIVCGGEAKAPKFLVATFSPGMVVGKATDHSALTGTPQILLELRLDKKIKSRWFDVADDWQTMFFNRKKDFVELLTAKDLRIQFGTFAGGVKVAQFCPAGINAAILRTSCGIDLK